MIVAFHPELKLDRIIIYISFAHSLEQLTTLHYFSREQITFIEPHLINMLKDMNLEVSKRKKETKKTLKKLFNSKFRR